MSASSSGGYRLRAGLTVLVLAPELYLPLREPLRRGSTRAPTAPRSPPACSTLIEEQTATAQGQRRAPPNPGDATVRLEDVSFDYPSRAGSCSTAVDVELAPGETVALVGPTGSGKTTLASLLLRLADPTSGRLLAGNVDLAACDPAVWREQIAWVPQRPTLFRGTVAENIRLGRPAADDDRMRRAAALAGADAFVADLPDGYDTMVGDGGRPLSAGQVQRIALARSFLRDAPLVILDEPTADLDPVSAGLVGEAVERLRDGRSILLLVHRPELARRADRIVTIDAGRIVESARDAA